MIAVPCQIRIDRRQGRPCSGRQPLHLQGVGQVGQLEGREVVLVAGDGEDGRIKSAVGIGTLLEDGIGEAGDEVLLRVVPGVEPELDAYPASSARIFQCQF